MSRRQLLAFKCAPTVELRFGGLMVEVKDNRVELLAPSVEDGPQLTAWFTWDEWRDFAARIEHSIHWVETNTPDDVTGRSFTVEDGDDD